MKLKLSLIIIILFSVTISFAQNQNDDIKLKLANDAMKSASGNEKSIFGGYITGVSDLLSTNSGTLNLQGSLFGLGKVFTGKAKDTLDYNYIKDGFGHMLLRNTQINFGLSPDNNKSISVDTMTFGVTFSILNNKKAKGKIWKSINKDLQPSKQIELSITSLEFELFSKKEICYDNILKQFIHSNGSDSSNIDTTLRRLILESTGAKSLNQIYAPYNNTYQNFTNMVTKQWLWTATLNGKYNFTKSYICGIIASSTVSKVFIADNKKGRQLSFQLTPSYITTVDTTEKSNNTNRSFSKLECGGNYMFCKSFEINLTGGWSHIINGDYKNETQDQYVLSLTPRIKINDNFWLPITIKYDLTHPQFFGFISIQYSLK